MNRQEFFKWLGLGAMASIVPGVVDAAPEQDFTELEEFVHEQHLQTVAHTRARFVRRITDCEVLEEFGFGMYVARLSNASTGDTILIPHSILNSNNSEFHVWAKVSHIDKLHELGYWLILPFSDEVSVTKFNCKVKCYVTDSFI